MAYGGVIAARPRQDGRGWIVPPVYQYDKGVRLFVPGYAIAQIQEVHFANRRVSYAVEAIPSDDGNGIVALIPDTITAMPEDILCYLYYGQTDVGEGEIGIPSVVVADDMDLVMHADYEEVLDQFRLDNGDLYFSPSGGASYLIDAEGELVPASVSGHTETCVVIPMIRRPAPGDVL